MKKLLSIICILLTVGCSDKKPEKSINEPSKSEDTLISEIINNGNEDSLDELFYSYMDDDKEEYILPYALIMADKYKYDMAALHVFMIFCDKSNSRKDNDLSNLDEESRKLAIKYLIQASLTHPQAKEIYGNYLIEGKYVKKDIEAGEKLLKEVDNYNKLSR